MIGLTGRRNRDNYHLDLIWKIKKTLILQRFRQFKPPNERKMENKDGRVKITRTYRT